MSEQIHEQISAFLDDELSPEESAFLVRRLSSDALAREQTIRYATFGSVLREDAVLANSALLRDRIHAVLDGATQPRTTERPAARRSMQWTRGAAAAGVALAVAATAVLGLRQMNTDPAATQRAQVPAVPGAWTEPDSYVVPGDTAQPQAIAAPPIRLTNYLMQHGNYASTLNRTSVRSNVISSTDAAPADDDAPAASSTEDRSSVLEDLQ